MNRKLLVLGVLVLISAVMVAGCTEDVADEIDSLGDECTTSEDCPGDDLMCSDGECVPSGGGAPGGGAIQ